MQKNRKILTVLIIAIILICVVYPMCRGRFNSNRVLRENFGTNDLNNFDKFNFAHFQLVHNNALKLLHVTPIPNPHHKVYIMNMEGLTYLARSIRTIESIVGMKMTLPQEVTSIPEKLKDYVGIKISELREFLANSNLNAVDKEDLTNKLTTFE